MANSGVPIEKISKILGHSSLSVTATHYIYSRDLDEAALAYNLFNNRTFDNRQIDNRIIDDRQIDNKLTLKQSIANTKAMFENEIQKRTRLNTENNTNTNTLENTKPNTFTENTLQNVNENNLQNTSQEHLQNFTQNNTNTFTNNFTKDNINILEILSSLTAEVCDFKSLLHQRPLTN